MEDKIMKICFLALCFTLILPCFADNEVETDTVGRGYDEITMLPGTASDKATTPPGTVSDKATTPPGTAYDKATMPPGTLYKVTPPSGTLYKVTVPDNSTTQPGIYYGPAGNIKPPPWKRHIGTGKDKSECAKAMK